MSDDTATPATDTDGTDPTSQPVRLSKKKLKAAKAKDYLKTLRKLQTELCLLQEWVKATGQRIIIVFEGRDAAGKGGLIRAITERVSPRIFKVVALPAPSDREKSQLYIQRYLQHFPAAGEVVIFDRSWYNRAGVERVMGFCTPEEHKKFLKLVPAVEKLVISDGVILIKYWLEVGNEEQKKRFEARIDDPLRQWKLSPMDLPSRKRWYEYSLARDQMLDATDTELSPWNIVHSDDKKSARLNCIADLLSRIDYKKVQHEKVKLPERSDKHAYDDEATMKDRRWIKQKY
jgi:polyphosphate kinase